MKLFLNPSKPFYIDKKNMCVRMGNFPKTGKAIDYEGDDFLLLIENLKKPIERSLLIKKICKKTIISEKELNNVLDYLISESFVVNKKEIDLLLSDKKYNRQNLYFYMMSNKNLISNFNTVKNKNILILGVGGIGSIVLELLTRAGFTNFTVIDFDKVEESNLIRQLSYNMSDVGKYKVNAVMERMKSINNNISIKKVNKKIKTEIEVIKEIKTADFVVCTLDKPIRVIRKLINKICVNEKKPIIFSGFAEHMGMVGPFIVPDKSACLECIGVVSEEEFLNNVSKAPSFGPLCNLIASIVASEIINYYVQFKSQNLIGSTLMVNMYDYSFEKIDWKRKSDCKKCGDK